MAFTDELTIHAAAGNGGNGVVRWLHTRSKEYGGPAGGDGGRGGSVYAVAVRNVYLLATYKNKKKFEATSGGDGQNSSLKGADGENLNIELPIGSVITNNETGEKIALSREGERVLLLKGGSGGRGNESFKSSTNRSPREWTPGMKGQVASYYIEVELIADIGLIGLPSAGKTSLLNELTNAKGKTGDYPFTTLEPNLGEVHGYIISDIPGLIDGAADGKGLGHKFLRHVRRTNILVHLLSLENEDPAKAYRTIRHELEQFDNTLIEKKELVVLTKTDLIDDQELLRKKIAGIKKTLPVAALVTIYDDAQVKSLKDLLLRELSQNHETE